MTDDAGNPDAKPFLEELDKAEKRLSQQAAFVKKAKARLLRTAKALSTKPAVAAQVTSLLGDLKAMQPNPEAFSAAALANALDHHLRAMRQRFSESFAAALRAECETANLPFKQLQDGFGVGAFRAIPNPAKEVAAIQYAKIELVKDVPLNARAIVARVVALRNSLFDPPVQVPQFANQLEEAMRVALVRQRRSKAELRVDLPAVHRELTFIREGPGRKAGNAAGYTVSRFVVELKTLVQSDQNLAGDRQFRLEPAVLENTKDPRKSVFIPNDLGCGYGEGSYYQAITLRSEA